MVLESILETWEELESEMFEIRRQLETDYGPDDVYATLEGHCYSYSDRSYDYFLCPFNKVSQMAKSGGREVIMGTWSGWSSSKHYPVMIYNNGELCWNGPQRSTKVFVDCGIENEVTKVVEPEKCEYRMLLKSPAACKIISDEDETTP